MRGKKGVKCCGQWNQPCRCPKPCTNSKDWKTGQRKPCRCPNCDCAG